MANIICKECGVEIVGEYVANCPNCGCPVERGQELVQENTNPEKDFEQYSQTIYTAPAVSPVATPAYTGNKGGINVGAIISVLIGLAIIIIGIVLMNSSVTVPNHSATSYSVKSAKFGADFYTYMYDASDTMVSELDEINHGIQTLSESSLSVIMAINHSVGMLIIAIGLCTIAVAFPKVRRNS